MEYGALRKVLGLLDAPARVALMTAIGHEALENRGTVPAVEISVDIVKQE